MNHEKLQFSEPQQISKIKHYYQSPPKQQVGGGQQELLFLTPQPLGKSANSQHPQISNMASNQQIVSVAPGTATNVMRNSVANGIVMIGAGPHVRMTPQKTSKQSAQ